MIQALPRIIRRHALMIVLLVASIWLATLWYQPAPLPMAAQPQPPQAVTAAATITHRETLPLVLYIEDNPANLKLMRKVLPRIGALTLIDAPDGAQGLAMAKSSYPDLILLDIEHGIAAGFNDYLTKPFDLDLLQRSVGGWLDKIRP